MDRGDPAPSGSGVLPAPDPPPMATGGRVAVASSEALGSTLGDGEPVGAAVTTTGAFVACGVGFGVGLGVGRGVGLGVGRGVGLGVGFGVGLGVGFGVGVGVGA